MVKYELYHAGIKGMKWGVRRYQNADGSLTDAGKKRYNQEADAAGYDRTGGSGRRYKVVGANTKEGFNADAKKWVRDDRAKVADRALQKSDAVGNELLKANQHAANISKTTDAIASRKAKAEVMNMDLSAKTNKQLKQEVNRMNLEKQYKQAMLEKRANIEAGKIKVSEVLSISGDAISVGMSAATLAKTIKGIVKS